MPHKSQMEIDGLPVRNLTKPIKLIISEEDCSKGHMRAPNSCAAALAARRLPEVTEARIHIGRIFLRIGQRHWLRGKTPGALRTEIVSFDRGGKFEPGEYTIRPLSKSELPNGARKSPKAPKHGRPGKHRVPPKILHSIRNNAHTEYRFGRKVKKVSKKK